MIPTGTLFAFGIAAVFVGATFTETLFGWHGMGEYLITTLTKNDINGTVAVAAFSARHVLPRRRAVGDLRRRPRSPRCG